jgi:hypothetical protein
MLIREKADASAVRRPSRSAGGPFHKDRFFSALGPFQKGHSKQTPLRAIGAAFVRVYSITIASVVNRRFTVKSSQNKTRLHLWNRSQPRRSCYAVRALNRNVERVFNPDRKDPHWGKRKLARDQ